jgi:hypothetical protein
MVWAICIGGQGGTGNDGEASGGGEASSRAVDNNFLKMSVRMRRQVQGRWGMTTIFILWMVRYVTYTTTTTTTTTDDDSPP